MPLDIINRDNVSDNTTLNLAAARSAATAVVNGVTYVFVASPLDDGVSVFTVGADGALTNVTNISDSLFLALDGVNSVTAATVGSDTYVFVAASGDNSVSVFRVLPGGGLGLVDAVTDDASLALSGANSLTTAVVGGVTYLFATGQFDHGVSVFSVGANGLLANVDNVFDDAALQLNFVSAVTTAMVGAGTFLFAAGVNGLSVFFVDAGGSLTNVVNVGDNASLALLAANSLATAEVDGVTYLFATSFPDSGVSVFEVRDDGIITNVDNVFDSPARSLRGASSVSTVVVGGTTYLFVAGFSEAGVNVFAVGAGGALSHVANIVDDATSQFFGGSSVATALVGGTPYLFTTGGDGVSAFELASDDTLIGTGAADTLDGLGGEDALIGLGGDDALIGGDGADTLAGGDGNDTLTGGAGDDDLHGDAGIDTAVFSGNQADYLVTALGNGAFEVADQRGGSPDGTDRLEGIESIAFADGTISLVGNAAPTGLALSHDTIAENSAIGALVGVLSASDPNAGDSFTYQLIDDAGGRFALDGALIEVAGALDFETAISHQVTVRVTDAGGLSHDETFTIGVTDVAEFVPGGSTGLTIINRDNVPDDATLNLLGAFSTATAVVGGTTYLFVAGLNDNGVSVFAVGADGALANVVNVADDATLRINGATSVATAEIGGTTYLFVAGSFEHGVSVFEVGADGSLANVDNVADDATLELLGAYSVTTATVGGATYLFVAGLSDNGVSVFSVDADGFLTNVDNVADDATLRLASPVSVATAEVGGITYLFVVGSLDHGVSVFAVGADGTLINVANVSDNDDAALNLSGAAGVTTAEIGGTTYLFVAGSFDNGVSVFAVGADGSLLNVDNVSDDATLNLHGANSVAAAEVGGVTYLFVAGAFDNGVSVFTVDEFGALANVANIADDATLNLARATAATTALVGGANYLFVAGQNDGGVSVFELATDDTLLGTGGSDALDGLGGNDLVIGLGGNDDLVGGAGTDTLLGGDGNDTLVGGAANDDLYGDAGTDTAVFSGNRADYLITDLGGGVRQITDQRAGAPDGTDTLHGVENLVFAAGPPGEIVFTIARVHETAAEGPAGSTTRAYFVVSRSGDLTAAASVDYAVAPPPPNALDAASLSDFAPGTLSGSVSFAPGEATRTIFIDIAGDNHFESNETFAVALSNPSAGVTGPAAQMTIVDDDAATPAPAFQQGPANPFGIAFDFNVVNDPLPVFADIDGDGDFDLFTRSRWQENIGTATVPDFAAPAASPLPAAPQRRALGDIDGDGDLDAFTLASNGGVAQIGFDENAGTATAPDFSVARVFNPFGLDPTLTGQLFVAYENGRPTLADIDDDGDLDLFVVAGPAASPFSGSNVFFIENTGTATAPDFSSIPDFDPFGLGAVAGARESIDFLDADGDGDLDAAVSENGAIVYYENVGSPQTPVFIQPAVNPFAGFAVLTGESFPAAAGDIDGDGDDDFFAVVNPATGGTQLQLFENVTPAPPPGPAVPPVVLTDPTFTIAAVDAEVREGDSGATTQARFVISRTGDLSGPASVSYALVAQPDGPGAATAPDFASALSGVVSFAAGESVQVITLDIAGDDFFEGDESFAVALSDPSAGAVGPAASVTIVNDDRVTPVFSQGPDNPFGLDITYALTTGGPYLADIDGDGDLDLFASGQWQESIGTPGAPAFAAGDSVGNPLRIALNTHFGVGLDFGDIDGDGDLDYFSPRSGGSFYLNIGDARHPTFGLEQPNPFGLAVTGFRNPELVDIDNDGDLDLFVTQHDFTAQVSEIIFIENVGSATDPNFAPPGGIMIDPFGLSAPGGADQPTVRFSDLDHDGDFDALVTNLDGAIYFENIGTPEAPNFQIAAENPFAAFGLAQSLDETPLLGDIDGDGDDDLLISLGDSVALQFFENVTPGPLVGTAGNDVLSGTAAGDAIRGLAGDDTIDGDAGDDLIEGESGDDTLTGGTGNDRLFGDAGTDTAVFSGNRADYLITDLGGGAFQVNDQRPGSPDGTDILHGVESLAFADGAFGLAALFNAAPAIASGGGGGTTVVAVAENTTAVTSVAGTDPDGDPLVYAIVGGADAAWFQIDAATGALSFIAAPDFEAPADAGANNRYEVVVRAADPGGLTDEQTITVDVTNVAGLDLSGNNGDNQLVGSPENDTVRGLGGNDRLNGGHGADTLNGGAGNDTADYLSDGSVTVDLAAGTATTASGVDTLISIERVIGSQFADTLRGDGGDNVLDGAAGIDVIDGFGGNDRLEGGAGNDRLNGGDGNDEVIGQSGNDLVDGGNGDDLVRGGDGHDSLEGRDGNDRLEGEAGDDTIDAGAGNDLLFGGNGNDRLFAAGGTDTLTGGAGNDLFFYTNPAPGQMNGDTITDFQSVAGQNTGDSLVIRAGFSSIVFNNGSTAISYNGVAETIFHPGVTLSLANDVLVL